MRNNYLSAVIATSLLLIYSSCATAQSICIDSVIIDGSITKYMGYYDFISTGIKIDSIIKPDPMQYADNPESVIYVGSSVFFLDKGKRCDARTIWFDKIESVKLGKYHLSKLTTYDDLKRMFPTECSSTKPIKHKSFKGAILQTCSLSVQDSKGQIWDMRIIFYIQNSMLIGLHFWEPV